MCGDKLASNYTFSFLFFSLKPSKHQKFYSYFCVFLLRFLSLSINKVSNLSIFRFWLYLILTLSIGIEYVGIHTLFLSLLYHVYELI